MGLSLYVPWWCLPIALVTMCFIAGRQHDCRLRGTAVTLLTNWCMCTTVTITHNDPYPVAWFAIADYLSALVVVLLIPLGRGNRSRWQVAIGLLYASEFIVHAFVAWIEYQRPAELPEAQFYGYHTIYMIAWAQVAVVAAWRGRAFFHRRRLRRRGMAYRQSLLARRQA